MNINTFFQGLKAMLMGEIEQVQTYSGMGAIPHSQGTAFRVWAPNAKEVYVTGSFNNWSETENPLDSEENGYWYGDFKEAQVGDEYRYIIVNKDTGESYKRKDPYSKEVTNSSGNSIIISSQFQWDDRDFTPPNWNELVIYEMHIGTFNDKSEDKPGTFKSAARALPYLKELGINAIEIMPSAEFAGDYSWGYNPSDIFAVESAYGGSQGLKKFVNAAHKNGMMVILDVIYNHLGPSDLDLWQFDGWSENEGGGIYFYNDRRGQTAWGHTRPDYGRPEVRQFLRDNVLMWLTEYHIDGLRWDSTLNIRSMEEDGTEIPEGWSLMQWINEEVNSRFPEKIAIAEDLRNNEWITKETGVGGAGFDAQWDPQFIHPVRGVITASDDHSRDLNAIQDAITHQYNSSVFERVIFLEAHDEPRLPEEVWSGNAEGWFARKRSTLGTVLVLTSPGIPMIFQGQEFLEYNDFEDTEPLDLGRRKSFRGIFNLYRDLIRLRRNLDGNTRGLLGQSVSVYHVNNTDKLLAFHRWETGGPKDDVVIVVNLADRSYESYNLGFPKGGGWRVRFNSDSQQYGSDFGNYGGNDILAEEGEKDGLDYNGNIAIGPYSALILSQDPEDVEEVND
ncbi:alpha-amylase family glycosyl hydrolase [Limnoraphis robusta]|uniref:1,4-alpha-glucan branching enzyme n=1 Tax=Limnoraphis robusta CCNP1315 TaxID=3110306 RepID=A0ABU5U5U5_9CYAN|nr:alpha-amylase family glycosyl hydrolase [Limnoraphis robusta]MEA5522291.1 alpha-amylase family glycosyl hydrolase [Limnoraphis robusta CCNP1315]MEA5544455.1 alpha-amylase family glycosyl hydrolase [Limnoraphis robusta CCNP1324]